MEGPADNDPTESGREEAHHPLAEQNGHIERRPARRRKLRFKLAALGIGLVTALLIAEIALRAMGGPEDVGPATGSVAGSDFPFLDAFPEHLDRAARDEHWIKIAFLGDSFTYGQGVQRDETFAHLTGIELKDRWPVHCITLNLGRPGADVIREWAVYNRVRDVARPHVLVHVIAPNDLDIDLYRDTDRIARFRRQRLWPSRYSHLFGLAETRVRQRIANHRTMLYLHGGETLEQRDRAWRIVAHEIEATRQLAETGGAAYVLARFPLLLRLSDYPLEEVHARGAEMAKRLGIDYLDLLDSFRCHRDETLMVNPNDDHPNPDAHRIAARAIAEFLAENVLPKLPRPAASLPTSRRTGYEVVAAERQHYLEVLRLDPTCFSAQHWLRKLDEALAKLRR